LRTQAYIASKVNAITREQMNHIVEETKQINRMLTALANSLKKQGVRKNEN
jgi:four helix bundle protein